MKFLFRIFNSINNTVKFFILIGLLCVLPFVSDDYVLDTATNIGIYVTLSLGLNLVVGFAGLLNIGYVAFYAVGAYTTAILTTQYHVPFFVTLLLGGVFAGVFGFLLATPVLRLRGDYLAIVTLGFGEITRIVLKNWDALTNGPNGIDRIPPVGIEPFFSGTLIHFYYVVLFFTVMTALFMNNINRSRIGRAWIAIREDEIAASSMGINVVWMKILAFIIGAVVAGFMGSIFASKMAVVTPDSFNFLESIMVLCMVILGGLGNIYGAIIGGIALSVLPELLRGLSVYRMLILSVIMIVLMIFRPQGLIGSTRVLREMKKKYGNY